MKFSIATIVACAAVLVMAQDGGPPDGGPLDGGPDGPGGGPGGPGDGPGGPGGRRHHGPPPPWVIKKHLTCPTAGGTATVSFPCPTGPPPTGQPSHPHSKPTDMPSGFHKWDGTVTVFPSGAPEVTRTMGIDCSGESGPSCSQVIFASRTCSPPTNMPKPTGPPPSFSHKSFPTVTASAGETKTVHASGPPTCKAATATAS